MENLNIKAVAPFVPENRRIWGVVQVSMATIVKLVRAGRSFRVIITVTVVAEWVVTERARVSLVTPELPVSCVSTVRITRLQNVPDLVLTITVAAMRMGPAKSTPEV